MVPLTAKLDSSKTTQLVQGTPTSQPISCPAQQLPPELLGLIFLNYDERLANPLNLRWKDLPWSISQVSRQWRHVSHSIPSLWNRIPKENMSAEAEAVAELLQRSKDTLLSFSVSLSPLELAIEPTHSILDLLIANCERWEAAHFEMDSLTISHSLGPLIGGRLPRLRRLALELRSEFPYSSAPIHIIEAFFDAPSLEEVVLVDFPPNLVKLPWKQIKYIKDLTTKPTTTLSPRVHGTGAFPNLKRVELARFGRSIVTFPPQTIFRLTILRIRFGRCYSILLSLTLPALQELIILSFRGNPIPVLTELFLRSNVQQSLKVLSIRATETASHASYTLRGLFETIPALATLEMNLHSFSPTGLGNLIATTDHPILLPNLEFLTLVPSRWAPSIDPYRSVIVDIARTRCEHTSANGSDVTPGTFKTLKTFRISFGHLPAPTRICHSVQDDLNSWIPAQSRAMQRLQQRLEQLSACAPVVSHSLGRRASKGTQDERPWVIRGVFEELEQHNFTEGKDLHYSRLHFFMFWISRASSHEFPQTATFKSRASRLLKRWERLLVATESEFPWVTLASEKPKELQYVPQHQWRLIASQDDQTYFERYARLNKLSPRLDYRLEEEYVPASMLAQWGDQYVAEG